MYLYSTRHQDYSVLESHESFGRHISLDIEDIMNGAIELHGELTRAKNTNDKIKSKIASSFGQDVERARIDFFEYIENSLRNTALGMEIGKFAEDKSGNHGYNMQNHYWREVGYKQFSKEFKDIFISEVSKIRKGEEGWKNIVLQYSERIKKNNCMWLLPRLNDERNLSYSGLIRYLRNSGSHKGSPGFEPSDINENLKKIDIDFIETVWDEALRTLEILLLCSKDVSVMQIDKIIENYRNKFSSKFYANGYMAKDTTKHLAKLGWGTDKYIRKQEVIDTAIKLVKNFPIVIFEGYGGSGKTALATKVLVEFANESENNLDNLEDGSFLDYFLGITSKGDLQGEYHNGKTIRVDETTNPFAQVRTPEEGLIGIHRRILSHIIEQYKTVNPSWDDDRIELECMGILIERKILVIIDNYEDLTSPNMPGERDKEGWDRYNNIINEGKKIDNFLAKFQSHGVMNIKSRIIITSRSPENVNRGYPWKVPLLGKDQAWELFHTRIEFNSEIGTEGNEQKEWKDRLYMITTATKSQKEKFTECFNFKTGDGNLYHPLMIITAANTFRQNKDIEELFTQWKGAGNIYRTDVIAYCCKQLVGGLKAEIRDFLKGIILDEIIKNDFTINNMIHIESVSKISRQQLMKTLKTFTTYGWINESLSEENLPIYNWEAELKIPLQKELFGESLGEEIEKEKNKSILRHAFSTNSPGEAWEKENLDIDHERIEEIRTYLAEWRDWNNKVKVEKTKFFEKYEKINNLSAIPILSKVLRSTTKLKIGEISKNATEKKNNLLIQTYIQSRGTLETFLKIKNATDRNHNWMTLYYIELLKINFDCIISILDNSKEKLTGEVFEGILAKVMSYKNFNIIDDNNTPKFSEWRHRLSYEDKEQQQDLDWKIMDRSIFLKFYIRLINCYFNLVERGLATSKGHKDLNNAIIEFSELLGVLPDKRVIRKDLIIENDEIIQYIKLLKNYKIAVEKHLITSEPGRYGRLKALIYWASLKLSITKMNEESEDVGDFEEYWKLNAFYHEGVVKVKETGMIGSYIKSLEKSGWPSFSEVFDEEWILNGKEFLENYKDGDSEIKGRLLGRLIFVEGLSIRKGWPRTKPVNGVEIILKGNTEDMIWERGYICKINAIHGEPVTTIIVEEIDANNSKYKIPKNNVQKKSLELVKEIKEGWTPEIIYKKLEKLDIVISNRFNLNELRVLKWINNEFEADYNQSFVKFANRNGVKLVVKNSYCGIGVSEEKWREYEIKIPNYIENNEKNCDLIFSGETLDGSDYFLTFPILPSILAWRIRHELCNKRGSVDMIDRRKLAFLIYENLDSEEKKIEGLKSHRKNGHFCKTPIDKRIQELGTILKFMTASRDKTSNFDFSILKEKPKEIVEQIHKATIEYVEWHTKKGYREGLEKNHSNWKKVLGNYFTEVSSEIDITNR